MPFTLSCPSCGAKLKATEAFVGKTVKCPRCSKPVLVQEPKPAAVATMPRMELPPSEVEAPVERPGFEDDDVPEPTRAVVQHTEEEIVDELPEVDDEDEVEEAEFDEATPADDDDYDRPRRKKRRASCVTQEDKQTAMFIYLLGIFTGFIGPLILWMMKRDQSKFIDHHGKEMINFSITVAIVAFAVGLVGGPLVVITFGLGALIVVPLMMALHIYALVMLIINAMKANKGEWCEFPITMRLIK